MIGWRGVGWASSFSRAAVRSSGGGEVLAWTSGDHVERARAGAGLAACEVTGC